MSSTPLARVEAGYWELTELLVEAGSTSDVKVTDAQLLGLQHRWTTALSARLDAAIEFAGDGLLTDAVARAWQELAADQSTLRGLLDAAEGSLVLAEARRVECRMLALAAGLAELDDPPAVAAERGLGYWDLIRVDRAATGRRPGSPRAGAGRESAGATAIAD
jgi:hypothetical protein